MPYSQEFLDRQLNSIPDSDLDDALSTTWEQQVDVSLAAAIDNIYAMTYFLKKHYCGVIFPTQIPRCMY